MSFSNAYGDHEEQDFCQIGFSQRNLVHWHPGAVILDRVLGNVQAQAFTGAYAFLMLALILMLAVRDGLPPFIWFLLAYLIRFAFDMTITSSLFYLSSLGHCDDAKGALASILPFYAMAG
ncbi:unnamed protein product [Vitrella brassicaformis CCMP3155]|uniref:Uncharacterized protein n=1 Tax=Vitrella brassicaformis (strain CCMP3155) TaxID=1169540 RepID=A0A0G4FPJ7_VITBC|nr:unnamed protein product [Vitrella brassicaformis CCMP3155]|eukprot:CEM16304.1 unnamed protein product [Vitrella brassicaformis CCMP3155]